MQSRNPLGALTRQDFTPVVADEQRTEPRHDHRRPIQILPCFTASVWEFVWADLVDCSNHGLGFMLDEPMAAGEDFLVKLRLEKALPLLLLYTVRHCTPHNGRYRMGAQFRGLAADPFKGDGRAIVEALLAPLAPEDEPDR